MRLHRPNIPLKWRVTIILWGIIVLILAPFWAGTVSREVSYRHANDCPPGKNDSQCINHVSGTITTIRRVTVVGDEGFTFVSFRATLRTDSGAKKTLDIDSTRKGKAPNWLTVGSRATVAYWRGHQMAVSINGHRHKTSKASDNSMQLPIGITLVLGILGLVATGFILDSH